MSNLSALLVIIVLSSTPLIAAQQSGPVDNPPEIVYVKCGLGENFGVHEVPSGAAKVIAKVNCGDVLISFGEEQEFYKVRTEQGLTGYISSGFISTTKLDAQKAESQVPAIHPEVFYVKCGFGEVAIYAASSANPDLPEISNTIAKVNCGDTVTSNGEAEGGFQRVQTVQGVEGIITTAFISKTKQEVTVSSTAPSSPLPTPSASAKKKEKARIIVEVVETQTSQRQFTTTIPGTGGTSQTTCNTNGNGSVYGTNNGGTVNGTVNTNSTTNCTTTSQPGTPPMSFDESIAQEYVHVIWPGGTHVTLWCQNGFRKCATLAPGMYQAEVKGNVVWIYANDLSGKEHKINYKSVGQGW